MFDGGIALGPVRPEGSGSLVKEGEGEAEEARSGVVVFAVSWDEGSENVDSSMLSVRRLGRCTASILSKTFPINLGW